MHQAKNSPPLQKSSRFAAVETLVRLDRTRYPVKPLFETVADECRLVGVERGLAMNLVYGVLRRRDYLRLLLGQLCRQPIDQLDPHVLHGLEIGLYQLFFLSRIPESAAVNETVNAVKAAGLKKHLLGFVNGVLRGAVRNRATLPAPDAPGPDGSPLLNHPRWLTDRWQKRFGKKEMERICAVNNTAPSLVLRVNTAHISVTDFTAELTRADIISTPGIHVPGSLVLPDYQGSVTSLPGFRRGWFQVQDEAAQLACWLLGPFDTPASYLDCCAGLGGKTSHILQLAAAGSRVVGIEPEPYRFRLLKENLQRLALPNTPVIHNTTLQDYGRTSRLQFDRVLVDAPCSGTGVIGRQPDIRWNRNAGDITAYSTTQLALLEEAAELVAQDGVLVYATCSIEEEENQAVIRQFLAGHPAFTPVPCLEVLPSTASSLVRGDDFAPLPTGTIDGFFAARLIRRH